MSGRRLIKHNDGRSPSQCAAEKRLTPSDLRRRAARRAERNDMTWPQAKIEALRLVEDISREYGTPAEIVLSEYTSEARYREFKPRELWPWKFHTQVTRSTYRELLKRGYRVRLAKI